MLAARQFVRRFSSVVCALSVDALSRSRKILQTMSNSAATPPVHQLPERPTWSVSEIMPTRADAQSAAEEDAPSVEAVRSAAALAQLPFDENNPQTERAKRNMADLLHFVQYIHKLDTVCHQIPISLNVRSPLQFLLSVP